MPNTIDITELQEKLRQFANERDWNQYHSPKNLAMALSVEASELLEIFQWLNEAQSAQPNAEQQQNIRHEMADVFLYLLRMADILNIDLANAVQEKMALNAQRYPAHLAKGSAKKYTDYQ
jgi:NTP pyrophosphatase (non-canonical NTP hydrolase)